VKVIDTDAYFRESHLPNGESQFRCHCFSLFAVLQSVGLAPVHAVHAFESIARRSVKKRIRWRASL